MTPAPPPPSVPSEAPQNLPEPSNNASTSAAAQSGLAWWTVPMAALGGALGALQALINSTLAQDIQSGFGAAAISFGVGLVLVAGIVLLRPALRSRTADFWRDLRSGAFSWPLALGGLGGALFVLSQALTVPTIGVALLIIAVVAGQTVTGLVVDLIGLGPGGARPLSAGRLAGAALMVVAVALAMSGGLQRAVPIPLLILPLIAGCALGLQQAVNGRVTQHSGHFLVATLGNFIVGTFALVLAAAAHFLFAGWPLPLPAEPLLYLGGVIGVGFIAIASFLAEPMGVLALAMCTIAGQIIGSVFLDATVSHAPLGLLTVVGALLTLVAAVVTVGLPPARQRGTSSRAL